MAVVDKENLTAGCTSLTANSSMSVPFLDVVSFAFERLDMIDPKKVIYADASNPSFCVLAGDVRPKVERLAAGLIVQGLQRGDCVCIHSFNSVLYPLLWLAVIAAGGIVTGSNPAYTSIELKHHLTVTDTKYVLVQADHLETVKNVVSQKGVAIKDVFVVGNDHISVDADLMFLNDIWKEEGQLRWTFDSKRIQQRTVAVYATTSGTTGLPKAAELSHKYLVTQVAILERVYQIRAGEIRQLVCLPVFHAFAGQLAITLPLRLGIATYFMPRFKFDPYLDHVLQLRITDVAVVPPIIGALNNAPPLMLQSLRYVLCAGAPMTTSVQTRLYCNLHPAATIAQVWGTTETGWITLFEPFDRDFSGSVGRLVPNAALKIVDDQGRLITHDNVSGEALIRSASMMSCYRNNVAANLGILDHDGFYYTGDRVYMQDGKIYINGRVKDVMKVNGWQVSPEEIERVVLELEEVKECAVAGYTTLNSKTGLEETKPRAYVVRQPTSTTLCATTVQEHVANRLVGYKRLVGGVVFVNSIPRTTTGKILRRTLNELSGESAG